MRVNTQTCAPSTAFARRPPNARVSQQHDRAAAEDDGEADVDDRVEPAEELCEPPADALFRLG